MKQFNIVFFTGAGISAESGISTFRDKNGLWENHDISKVCTVGNIENNYNETISFYDSRRVELGNSEPNKAHNTIAKLQQLYPNNIKVITQNVDDLFERAGCKDVLHLHGFLTQVYCINEKCDYMIDIGYTKQNHHCPKCNSKLRPNVVLFGENAPNYKYLLEFIDEANMIVVIGTSGNVINVNQLVQGCNYNILNNMEKNNKIYDVLFDEIYYEKATIAINKIEQLIHQKLKKIKVFQE